MLYKPICRKDIIVLKLKTVLNPDPLFIKTMKKKLKANSGYCPCCIIKTADQKCPCMDFRLQDIPGFCGCGYMQKVEDNNDAD